MPILLRIHVTLFVLCLTLFANRAYAQNVPTPSVPTISVPRNEACIPGTPAWTTDGDVGGATVSLTSMLVSTKAKRTYEHVLKALTLKNFDEAEKQLKIALSISPVSAVGWCLMGTLHEEKLELDKASIDYSQALSADSQLLPAYLGLARIAFREKRWHQVLRFTDQLSKVDPVAFPAAYFYNAAANFNLRDLNGAEKNARKFESLDTEHERPQVYLLLGDILARERHFAGAAEQKKFFLTIVPDADDTDEIKEQIKILEDLSKRKEKVGVTSIN